jgi:hypothetical protein
MNNTGQICRSKKNAQSRYTMIDNAILQSWELTPEEKSILIYLLSMPENWIVIKSKLINDSNIGRDRFNRAWKGLQEKGYVLSVRVIDAKTNQIKGWNHIVYEQPVLSETTPILDTPRVTEIPLVGNPESRESRKSENQSVYKELNKENTNETKERVDKEKPKPKKGFVPPTIEEVSSKFPEINAERFVNYYESIGWKVGKNKMESWVAAAAGWISRDKPQTNVKFEIKNKATLNDD